MKKSFVIILYRLAIVFTMIGGPVFAEDIIGSIQLPLLGGVEYEGCTAPQTAFLKDAQQYGRIASVSAGFAACISTRVDSTYRKCPTDPFANESIATQTAKVMAVSTAPNRVKQICQHVDERGNASAGFVRYAHDTTVSFGWKKWLDNVVDQMSQPVCARGEEPGDDNSCRHSAYPWPFSQAAGIIWHEGMHTHTYTHGDRADNGKSGCGYPASSDYNMWSHSMPYIVGKCITRAISDADRICSDAVNSCPGENQLNLVDANGTTCSCVNDPGMKGLGMLGVENGRLFDVAILPNGHRAHDGWLYGNSHRIVGTGDFNGSGNTDILISSSWGLGILTTDEDGGWRTLTHKKNGNRIGTWLLNTESQTFEGSGDFDGDGKDEFIIRSNWGIGILKLTGNDFSMVYSAPRNTWFGDWRWDASEVNGEADIIAGIGDMNADNRDDIVVKSPWGIGVLNLRNGQLQSLVQAPRDTWFGSWRWDATINSGRDIIESIADFDGNGTADILVTSTWGIGVISVEGDRFHAIVAKPSGSSFLPWRYMSRGTTNPHNVVATGDFNGDGREDIMLKSNGAIGLLSLTGNTFRTLSFATDRRRLGGWVLNTRDNSIIGAGDFDGNGRDEILIRSGWGVGIIRLAGNRLNSIEVKNGLLAGSWRVDSKDAYRGIGKAFDVVADRIIVQQVE